MQVAEENTEVPHLSTEVYWIKILNYQTKVLKWMRLEGKVNLFLVKLETKSLRNG